MVRKARISALALALVLLIAAVPAVAHAAPVREYQLQYSPAGDAAQSLLIVTAVLDPQASLPTSVTVPIPAGATLLWSGEILGGDPAADPQREAARETVGTMDVLTFSLEQSRIAQVEVALGPVTFSGRQVTGALTWTNPGDEVLVNAAIVAEAGATDVRTTPEVAGAVQTNAVGETLHPLGGLRLAEGGSYVIEVSWERGGTGAGAGGSSPVLPVLLGALVVAVIVLVVVIVRERTRARRALGDR